MALTQEERKQVLALVAKEGGLGAFTVELTRVHVEEAMAAATVLDKAATASVQDWDVVDKYVAGATNRILYSVMGELREAVASRDDSRLGSLLVTLYGAVKVHLSL